MQSNSQERLAPNASFKGSPALKKAFKAKNVDDQPLPASLLA